MGILDEAIREHLDLKRRRGADETEIARQEGEAFGPSRRPPAAAEAAAPAPSPALDEPATAYGADVPPPARPDDAPTTLAEPAEAGEAVAPPAHLQLADIAPDPGPTSWSSEPPAAAPPAEVAPEPPPAAPAPPPAAPAPPPAAPAPPLADHLGQPTRAFDPEEVRAAAAAEPEPEIVPADEEIEGDDVLEETPEFLQETPEHDRLWFEQRPPRDFDF